LRIVVDLQACQTASRARGIGRYTLAFVDALLRQRGPHEILLVLNAAFPDAVASIRYRFASDLPAERIVVFQTPTPVAAIDATNEWRARAAEHVREAFLASLAPDVVLVSSLFEGFVDDAVTFVSPTRAWIEAAFLYDLIPLLRPETLRTAGARTWYARKMESLRRADLLLAISTHARNEAIEALGMAAERVAVVSAANTAQCFGPATSVPPPIDGFDPQRAFVLYAGGFEERKNVPNLLAAYARLPAKLRDDHGLVLAGSLDADVQRALFRHCDRLGLRRTDIALVGHVSDEALAALYRACRAFVFPSLHEGFGLPVLEAMACGAPVIASRATSIPEVIGCEDALFDPHDPEGIARLLERVLSDDAFRARLAAHGMQRARAFSWDDCALRAREALERAFERRAEVKLLRNTSQPTAATRPKLAFVSPLPPERTGVATYSAQLLVPLARHYDIDVVTDQASVADPDVGHFPVRSTAWFDANATAYERVLYQLGNSPFHCRMFELMERHPGTAVLHDVHLGSVLAWMEATGLAPGIFVRRLYESHGYPALLAYAAEGHESTADRFPCSWSVLAHASGVIVHSQAALAILRRWYPVADREWRCIAQLRELPSLAGREAARAALGLDPDDILVGCFGFLHPAKLDHRLLEAWLASPLASDRRCRLAFVGENHGGAYGERLLGAIRAAPAADRITITGFVDEATYERYLLAADAAVQLRGVTRGETSRTVLDCLAYGLPLVVNATGAVAEIPEGVALRVAADFTDKDLADALARVVHDRELRVATGQRARKYVTMHHDPTRIAANFADALEGFARKSAKSHYLHAVRSIASNRTGVMPAPGDWTDAARGLGLALPRSARQVLVDVTAIARNDLHSGIERVVREILRCWLRDPPSGYRVEPVRAEAGTYVYARAFACRWLDIGDPPLADEAIDVGNGDHFVGLDWAADVVPQLLPALHRFRTLGMKTTFVVYDLLPVIRPEFFPDAMREMTAAWLHAIAGVADGLA
jgi:glycosyltransferase involved in cell wall biosynthesis